ncbi:MAG: response regulator [Candidatus Latescibacteria bacterium]|nr:response regulator [Candidatus Latescibacterota bacterium]
MRMLIVDDDQTVVDFYTQAARARGYSEITTALSGEEALGKVVQGTFDFITLDIRMPGASGLEILSPVRSMCPHAVIAVISGYLDDEPVSDLAGCADVVLQKPVDLATVNTLLDSAAKIARTMEEIRDLGTASPGSC